MSDNQIICQILLEIGSILHQNFTKCSIFTDSYKKKLLLKTVLMNSLLTYQIRGKLTVINRL